MTQKIRVGAVSYLNTKPLIYGFQQGMMNDEIKLLIDYPASIAKKLLKNEIDIGLVPVAILPQMQSPQIISEYCIASDGEVASVCLFSDVPLNEIEEILLDYQSKTSVALLKILLKDYWKINPKLVDATIDFENKIKNETAGLVIGDRALQLRQKAKYIYDLGLAWQQMTDLPFVFAAWVSNKKMEDLFIKKFNQANAFGFTNLRKVCKDNAVGYYDLKTYYSKNIQYQLSKNKMQGLGLFLNYLQNLSYN